MSRVQEYIYFWVNNSLLHSAVFLKWGFNHQNRSGGSLWDKQIGLTENKWELWMAMKAIVVKNNNNNNVFRSTEYQRQVNQIV